MSMPRARSAHMFYGIVDQPAHARKTRLLDAIRPSDTICRMKPVRINRVVNDFLRQSRLSYLRLLFYAVVLIVTLSTTAHAEAHTRQQAEFYIVNADDSWQSISERYLIPAQQIWVATGAISSLLL